MTTDGRLYPVGWLASLDLDLFDRALSMTSFASCANITKKTGFTREALKEKGRFLYYQG
jgi:hypothetical protein